MLSRDLEVTLNSAFKRARELRHEYMTVGASLVRFVR